MRSHSVLVALGFCLACCACQRESTPPADNGSGSNDTPDNTPDTPNNTPWIGGTTGDFGGACAPCSAPERQDLPLDDDALLGFSAQDVLDVIEGTHVGPVRWRDPCVPGRCDLDRSSCPRTAPSFTGTESELRLAVEHTGTPVLETCPERSAIVMNPNSYEKCTGTFLYIPLRATLRTSDGLLDEAIEELKLRVTPGESSIGVGSQVASDALGGALPSRLTELTALAWSISFGAQGAGANVYLQGAQLGARPELLGTLEVVDETVSCHAGLPLVRAE